MCQKHVSGDLGELLVWIEPKMSRSTVHPKPPTTWLLPEFQLYPCLTIVIYK